MEITESQNVSWIYRGKDRDIDGGKRVKGRKRHIITDTQGLLLAVKVHPANRHDSQAAFEVIGMPKLEFGRVKKIYADRGYYDELVNVARKELKYRAKTLCEKTSQRNSNLCQNVG